MNYQGLCCSGGSLEPLQRDLWHWAAVPASGLHTSQWRDRRQVRDDDDDDNDDDDDDDDSMVIMLKMMLSSFVLY